MAHLASLLKAIKLRYDESAAHVISSEMYCSREIPRFLHSLAVSRNDVIAFTMSITLVFIVVILALIAVVAFLVFKLTKSGSGGANTDTMLMLQNQLQTLTQTVDTKLSESQQSMQIVQQNLFQNLQGTQDSLHKALEKQYGSNTRMLQDISAESNKRIAEITEKLTKLDETNKQVVSFTDQLSSLEQVLTNTKRRGSLGEAGLEMILANILPPGGYKMQYQFADGDMVDAAVFIKDQVLPVDAKFSLENYRRVSEEKDEHRRVELEKEFKNDLKKRIDETAKYIKPKEGTLDFAFMFIPAEGIYYDLLVNEVGAVKVNTRSLIDYAFKEKKVIIVSPTTFAAYLQTVLQGLRALQIEESAKEIRKRVEMLGKHINAYDSYMSKLGGHLSTTVNSFNTAYKELGKIDKDVMKITDGEKMIEPVVVEKPRLEE